jgi:glutamate-ammonia-ligase adenylyltransferase
MTQLAEVALESTVALHARLLAVNHGEPRSADEGLPQQLIAIGMGKLGGGELNVSSDIDLIFVYPDEGETSGPRPIANREFFDRLGQRVIGALHDVSPSGYVFRVDMRLRPYGESGPLTTTFAGLEAYLETQGRAWERYAWLKARALTGDRRSELDSLVDPFVFRKYLDYDAYDGLRDVHRQIREQGLRRDYIANVKLGEGGIREIEFIVQAMQIVRGGRERELRVKGTLPALTVLGTRGLLPQSAVVALRDAYVFLRRIEHRLQYRDDQQTHQIPANTEERALLAEAWALPASGNSTRSWVASARRSANSSRSFSAIVGAPTRTSKERSRRSGRNRRRPPPRANNCASAGFTDPDALLATLARVRGSGRYLQLPALSRQRFDALIPQLLATSAANPGAAGAQAGVRTPADAAGSGEPAQCLPGAGHRASAAAAAHRQPDGRVGMGRRTT